MKLGLMHIFTVGFYYRLIIVCLCALYVSLNAVYADFDIPKELLLLLLLLLPPFYDPLIFKKKRL